MLDLPECNYSASDGQLPSISDCFVVTTGHLNHATLKGGYTHVTLPYTVTPYCDSVDRTRDHVTYQKLFTQ
jgi:hypothetical protein